MEYGISELKELATIFTKANNNGAGLDLKGISAEQMFVLMAQCQAEGINPCLVNKRYTMVMGKPTLKADTLLADFIANKGRISWLELTDRVARAIYKHPSLDGELEMCVTIDDLRKSGQANTATWKKYPRQMLRNALNREAIKTICPTLICEDEQIESVSNGNSKKTSQVSKPEQKAEIIAPAECSVSDIPLEPEHEKSVKTENPDRSKIIDEVRSIFIDAFNCKDSATFKAMCNEIIGHECTRIEEMTDEELNTIVNYYHSSLEAEVIEQQIINAGDEFAEAQN